MNASRTRALTDLQGGVIWKAGMYIAQRVIGQQMEFCNAMSATLFPLLTLTMNVN